MLEDLLDASRIAFGKVSVRLESFELRPLLMDALDEQAPHAQKAELHLSSQIAAGSCIVDGDRVRLRQIVDNLLSNAIKFTPAGGEVELILARKNQSAIVQIRDTGIGFDIAIADELFEPFVQRATARDGSAGGLGLGLAISSRLASLQNCSLTAASPGMGRGALFTLTVPISMQGTEQPLGAGFAEQFSPRSVLLVEDNKDLADGVAELLRFYGVLVRVAYDGPSAIKSALDTVPDVILCDLGLPGGMDGFAVARACRAEESLRSVRLVATSGYSAAEDHAKARTAGFDLLMVKPLSEESLREIVH
jgi:CheY-like chemotaxis protein/anti-sigma regulatory factor (Ser/Thr protein kinase)